MFYDRLLGTVNFNMNYQKETPKEVLDIFKRAGIESEYIDYYAFPEMFGSTSGPHGGIGGAAMSMFTVEAYVCQDIATVYVCSGKYKLRKGKYVARWH